MDRYTVSRPLIVVVDFGHGLHQASQIIMYFDEMGTTRLLCTSMNMKPHFSLV